MNGADRLRCAIYTRKSTEEGLEQDFNSLAAQRAACEAYIASQAGEGWRLIKTAYDDGGFSGGTMERPGLEALLAAVDRGEVNVIVVYKVDRLTRSLMDFARIVERLDAKGASFVSVTQAFNTTTSMGRLTLNVLLSFAQFEREITGERIRDKIALSKKRGLWMGGVPPLGYEARERTLAIVPHEAEIVRAMFQRYLELGSVRLLSEELAERDVRSKVHVTKSGRRMGGQLLWKGPLAYILTNRTYLGEIRHGAVWYPGKHEAIVARELFDAVAARLAEGAPRLRRVVRAVKRPLTGLLFDDGGNRMTPSHTINRQGRRFDYYTSHALMNGVGTAAGSMPRVGASFLENEVLNACARVFGWAPEWSDVRTHLKRVQLTRTHVRIEAEHVDILTSQARLRATETLAGDSDDAVLAAPLKLRPWGGRSLLFSDSGAQADPALGDLSLQTAIATAHRWRAVWMSGEASITDLAKSEGVDASYLRRVMRLAYLAPDLTRAILVGAHHKAVTLTMLVANDLPLSWDEQRTRIDLRTSVA